MLQSFGLSLCVVVIIGFEFVTHGHGCCLELHNFGCFVEMIELVMEG